MSTFVAPASVQLDAAFPLSKQARRIRTERGAVGLAMFDFAFRRAVSLGRPIEFWYTAGNDADFCMQAGLPCVALVDEEGQTWSAADLLQTLCRRCSLAKSSSIGNPATTSLVVI